MAIAFWILQFAQAIFFKRENCDHCFVEEVTIASASPGLLYVIKHTGAAGV